MFPFLMIGQTQIGEDIDGETSFDLSGTDVSLSSDGSFVAIGARGNDGNGENSGHVRVFDLSKILNTNDIAIKNNISIYPNPTSNNIQIKLDTSTVLEEVLIYDVLGKEVLKTKNVSINISSLISGVYKAKIKTDTGTIVKQFIVE